VSVFDPHNLTTIVNGDKVRFRGFRDHALGGWSGTVTDACDAARGSVFVEWAKGSEIRPPRRESLHNLEKVSP